MFSRKPKHPLRRPEAFQTQLGATPTRNAAVRVLGSSGENRLVLAVDLKYAGASRPLARLLKTKKQKQYVLEGLGLELYNRLDGKRTVEHLVDELMAWYKLTFFESRAMVLTYLRTLTDRGLIVMAMKDTAQPSAEKAPQTK